MNIIFIYFLCMHQSRATESCDHSLTVLRGPSYSRNAPQQQCIRFQCLHSLHSVSQCLLWLSSPSGVNGICPLLYVWFSLSWRLNNQAGYLSVSPSLCLLCPYTRGRNKFFSGPWEHRPLSTLGNSVSVLLCMGMHYLYILVSCFSLRFSEGF